MRIVQIVLDNPSPDAIFLSGSFDVGEDMVHFATQKDSFALRKTVWLHNVGLPLHLVVFRLLVELVSKVNIISWKDPR